MNATVETALRDQFIERRERIRNVVGQVGEAEDLLRLLREVDAALKKLDDGTLGNCRVCGERVDDDFLLLNPLIEYCLCELSPRQQAALQRDLELARNIQFALLPKVDIASGGWEVHHRYLPAGAVSGDYCDVVAREDDAGPLHFLLGDVSGKGVAAALLMARLNALFRSLIDTSTPIAQLVERANRLFTEGGTASHYVTLVCGRASDAGAIELCNAGHCPPLVVRGGEVAEVDATGYPVGIFDNSPYQVRRVELSPGDTLFLYSDGLTEATDGDGRQYGADRLARLLEANHRLAPALLAAACLKDVAAHQNSAPQRDDLTIMVVRRAV
jgi:sigma-B regulation protein RsbU (phosphoserine phosphatase)